MKNQASQTVFPSMYPPSQAQISLEAILKKNREEADRLLQQNAMIEAEMTKLLSEPPPPVSRTTMPPASGASRMTAEKEVIYAALAIVRSWQRRHKKNWKTQERELMNAVERLTWEP